MIELPKILKMKYILQSIKDNFRINNSIIDEICDINIGRLFYLIPVTVPVHFIHVYFFSNPAPNLPEKTLNWTNKIFLLHGIEAILMSLFLVLIYLLKKNVLPNTNRKFISLLISINFLFEGNLFSAFDQYVTGNITPFLITNIITGIFVLQRPLISLFIYPINYFIFYCTISLYQLDPTIILTNRVNGITASVLGMSISILFWHSNRKNILQERKIQEQNKEMETTNQILTKANDELHRLSIIDELSNLYNRRYFNKTLSEEIIRHSRSSQPLTLVFIDIDHFKMYNDSMGHQAGDVCIQKVAKILNHTAGRSTDIASRYGGEEFAIVLPQTKAEAALNLVKSLQKELEILNIPHPQSPTSQRLTLSVGIATIIPNKSTTPEELIRMADKALYSSKDGGRNRVTLVTE